MTPNQNPPPPPPPQPTPTTTTGECGQCGTHTRVFLHHVRLRGAQRRLCTSCVLRHHPSSFCPVCFAFYDSNPPHPSKRLSCSKCSSFTHSHCTTSSSSSSPFLCPPCSDPTFSLAIFNKTQNAASAAGGRTIDSKSAARLLCAAKIASASMVKAVLVARIEAEKKAKDAALARKRAREALEHVAYLIAKNKDRNNADGSVQLSGSASIFNVNKKQTTISHELVKNVQTDNNNNR